MEWQSNIQGELITRGLNLNCGFDVTILSRFIIRLKLVPLVFHYLNALRKNYYLSCSLNKGDIQL